MQAIKPIATSILFGASLTYFKLGSSGPKNIDWKTFTKTARSLREVNKQKQIERIKSLINGNPQ